MRVYVLYSRFFRAARKTRGDYAAIMAQHFISHDKRQAGSWLQVYLVSCLRLLRAHIQA